MNLRLRRPGGYVMIEWGFSVCNTTQERASDTAIHVLQGGTNDSADCCMAGL